MQPRSAAYMEFLSTGWYRKGFLRNSLSDGPSGSTRLRDPAPGLQACGALKMTVARSVGIAAYLFFPAPIGKYQILIPIISGDTVPAVADVIRNRVHYGLLDRRYSVRSKILLTKQFVDRPRVHHR